MNWTFAENINKLVEIAELFELIKFWYERKQFIYYKIYFDSMCTAMHTFPLCKLQLNLFSCTRSRVRWIDVVTRLFHIYLAWIFIFIFVFAFLLCVGKHAIAFALIWLDSSHCMTSYCCCWPKSFCIHLIRRFQRNFCCCCLLSIFVYSSRPPYGCE